MRESSQNVIFFKGDSHAVHLPPGYDGMQRGLQLSETPAAARRHRGGLQVTRSLHFTVTLSVTTDVTAKCGSSNCNG